MATVKFTSALKRFFPNVQPDHVQGETVLEILTELNAQHKGIIEYILDDQNALRKHVNIFINGSPITDKANLNQPIKSSDELFIIQALSGG